MGTVYEFVWWNQIKIPFPFYVGSRNSRLIVCGTTCSKVWPSLLYNTKDGHIGLRHHCENTNQIVNHKAKWKKFVDVCYMYENDSHAKALNADVA